MRKPRLAALGLISVALAGCDVSVNGGLVAGLAGTDQGPRAPDKEINVGSVRNFAGNFAPFCTPDDSATDPALLVGVPRINLSFCEFEDPSSGGDPEDRFQLGGLVVGDVYRIETVGIGNFSDTVLELFDSTGASFSFNDDNESGNAGIRDSLIEFTAAEAQVAVEVRSRGTQVGPGHEYTLRVTNLSDNTGPGTDCTPDAFEEDDSPSQARVVVLGSGPQFFRHNFCDDPVDYTLLRAAAGTSLDIATFNLDPSTNTVLEVFAGDSEANQRIASNDDSSDLSSVVAVEVPDGFSAVLIKTSSVDEAVGSDRGYSLGIASRVNSQTQPDEFEDNDTPETAVALSDAEAGVELVLNFFDDGVDYFTVPVLEGRQYTFRTRLLEVENGTDTVINVFRGPDESEPLAFDDDSGGNRSSLVQFLATETRTVLVRVSSFNNQTGPGRRYRFSVASGEVEADVLVLPFLSLNLPVAASLVENRLLIGALVGNLSVLPAAGDVSFFLSSDPVSDAADALNQIGGATVFPNPIAAGSLGLAFASPDVADEPSGIWYLGAALEGGTFSDTDANPANNRVVIPNPIRLTGSGAGACIDDPGDAEFVVGPDGPGTLGDDRAEVSPLVAAVFSREGLPDPPAQASFLYSHCVDGVDWTRIFMAAGQTVRVTTTGLGAQADAVVGFYRQDPGTGDLIFVDGNGGRDTQAGSSAEGPANSNVRYTSGAEDEFVFVRTASRSGGTRDGGYLLNLVQELDDRIQPDLLATVLSAPESATEGLEFKVRVRVQNQGNGPAGASAVGVGVACQPDVVNNQQELIFHSVARPVDALEVGASQVRDVRITVAPGSGMAGDCRVFAVADAQGEIAESIDDFNNPGGFDPAGDPMQGTGPGLQVNADGGRFSAIGRFLNGAGDRAILMQGSTP